MSRNLEHRVGRGIYNPLARLQLLRPIVPNDVSAGIGPVAQDAPACGGLEGLQHLLGKALGIGGQGLRRYHPRNLPVANGGVLSHRGLRQPGHRPSGAWLPTQKGQPLDVSQSGPLQIGNMQLPGPGAGPEGIHPHAPKPLRIRHRPCPTGVQHNQENTFHTHIPSVTNSYGSPVRITAKPREQPIISPSSLPLPAPPSSCP